MNASRFCDVQGIPDFERNVIERKWRGQEAYYHEWYASVVKEGFVVGEKKAEFSVETTASKEKK
jgi:hypothetical protein